MTWLTRDEACRARSTYRTIANPLMSASARDPGVSGTPAAAANSGAVFPPASTSAGTHRACSGFLGYVFKGHSRGDVRFVISELGGQAFRNSSFLR